MHVKNYAHNKKIFSQNLHLQNLCTVQICAFAEIVHFCIWKIICAADLRILCTTVFAHLQICDFVFAHLHICEFENFFAEIAHM